MVLLWLEHCGERGEVDGRTDVERCSVAGGANARVWCRQGVFCPQSQFTELLKRILCAELQESKQATRMGVEVETITPGDGKRHHIWDHIDHSKTTMLKYITF